ncbi:MAG: hypothetical protein C0501_21635 [Isosphaera sp.]|nr:hypothetical protein [Isosphaera sp.]
MSARAAALLAALLPVGCSYNPGYFPYLIPGGPVAESHAKPGGPGYFRNFDPKACKLLVTPDGQVNAPLGTAVVLVGTVADDDGQPRRSRRVEWLLDGPGAIVEADESGLYPGRGYKKDNRYAVTHTNYTAKTITRGNDDPGDDVAVAAGQTFCVVSSAVPGETVVTAYAPEVFNWANNRVTVRIVWGDGRFSFPAPAVVRSGGEHTLATVATAAADPVPGGYRVRYRVLDGPPAVLVGRSGTSQSGAGGKEAEATTDADGRAAVRLVQQTPAAGKTRVIVEVVKPPEAGAGPGTVVARRETAVEWAEPKVHLAVTAPPAAAPGGAFPVTVGLENDAGVESRAAQVRVALSDGAALDSSDPPPTRQDRAGTLTFDLPPVPGKGKQQVALQVRPARAGAVTVTADAATGDGHQATGQATTRIEAGKLRLLVEGPAAGAVGRELPFKVAVTNGGAVPAGNVVVWARPDPGLRYATPHDPVELAVGTLQPGQTKTVDLPLTATRAGRFAVRATATADGELTAAAEPAAVEVRRVEVAAAVAGPKLAYLNQDFDWAVTVRNAGDAAVTGVVVRAAVPAEVRVRSADGGAAGPGSVEWRVAELRPGEAKTFTVAATGAKLADRANLAVAVTADGSVGAEAEGAVAVIGTAAVVLELATPGGPVEVGKRVAYRVRVKNQGTVSARDVEVSAVVPPELRPVRAAGPGGRVAFPVVEELRPGEARTFTVEADAVQAGDARFRAEVKAAHLARPLAEEQATRVTGR